MPVHSPACRAPVLILSAVARFTTRSSRTRCPRCQWTCICRLVLRCIRHLRLGSSCSCDLSMHQATQTVSFGSQTPSALGSLGYKAWKSNIEPMSSEQKHDDFRECPLRTFMSVVASRGNALYRRHRCIQDEPHHSYIHEFDPRGVRYDSPSCCREPWSSNVAVPVRCTSGTLLASSTVQYRPPILPSATLTVAVRHHVTDDHRRVVWDDKPTTVGVRPDPRARHSTMSPRRPGTQSSASSLCPALSVRSLAFIART